MADEADPGEGRQSLPEALGKFDRTITLSEEKGTVVVPKWAWRKSVKVLRELSRIIKGVGEERAAMLRGKNTLEVVSTALDLFGEEMIPFLKICVREKDADKVTEDLQVEDVFSLLEAVIELNMKEGLTKKVVGLWKQFKRAKTGTPTK